MNGLIVLLLAPVWLIVSIALAVFVARRLPGRWWRVPLAVLLALVLYPLPVIDSIVGGIQFEQLCKQNATIHVDAKAAGRTVYLSEEGVRRHVEGTWVPVVLTEWRFVDAGTGETVVTYNTVKAGYGFFGLAVGGDQACSPKDAPSTKEAFQRLGITFIQRREHR